MPGGVWEMPDKKQNNVNIVSDECEQTMDLSQESFARLKFDNKSLKTAKKRLLLRVGNVILGVEAGHYTR